MNPLQKETEDALDALPRCSSEIYSFLASCGVKGRPCDPLKCPIANYIHGKILDSSILPNPLSWQVRVGSSEVRIIDEDTELTVCRLSPAVAKFVVSFDRGSWWEYRRIRYSPLRLSKRFPFVRRN